MPISKVNFQVNFQLGSRQVNQFLNSDSFFRPQVALAQGFCETEKKTGLVYI